MKKILCSIVIPTYNRSVGLTECLRSVLDQTVDEYEVIVVDDASVHDARALVETGAKANPSIPVHYLRREKNGGHGAARNTGVTIAQGTIVLFTDDDCIVPRDWVEKHLDAHQRFPEAVGVGGWYWSPLHQHKSFFDRFFEHLFESTYPHIEGLEVWTNTMHSPAGNTANMSYKIAVFRELSGFDEAIYFTGGIDWEFKARCIAHGKSLVYIPSSVQHRKEFTIRSFFSKAFKLGRGLDYIASKYPGLWRPSLYSAFDNYRSWKTTPLRNGDMAYSVFWWVIALTCGKWYNRLVRFFPTQAIPMRSEHYFTFRFRSGVRVSLREIVPFKPTPLYRGAALQKGDIPLCSVVIPTFNRRELVVKAVRAVLAQEYINPFSYELIVVDDGSTDGTNEAIRTLAKEYPDHSVTVIEQVNQGAASARNTGAQSARGEFIFFTDSDCTVQPSWLWRTLRAYDLHPDIVGTGGGFFTAHPNATLLDRHRNAFSENAFARRYRNYLVKSNDITEGVLAYDTACMSVRASAFKAAGGFYPVGVSGFGLYHEDVDFAFRVQKSVGPMALVPSTAVQNQRLLSLKDFMRVAYVRGATQHALCARIAPHGVHICHRPTWNAVVVTLIQSLLRPRHTIGWVQFLNMCATAIGYYRALPVVERLRRDPGQKIREVEGVESNLNK